MQTVQVIAIDDLVPHADNPRLMVRDDVVESISVQLSDNNSVFDPAHALLVRPLDNKYQILSGHHRYEAAKNIGLTEIPCWVRELSDADAYMQLVLSNMQGELSPLEIGVHVLGAVELSSGGDPRVQGGVKNYARQVVKTQQYISQLRKAAEVLKSLDSTTQVVGLLDRTKHLYEISKAPPEVWELLVEKVIDKTVNQVSDVVKDINKFNIPEKWQVIHLRLLDVISAYLEHKNPMPKDVDQLIVDLDNLGQLIDNHATTLGSDFPYSVVGFHQWLQQGIGIYSWDRNKIQEYRNEVINKTQELSKAPEPEPQLGEWWQLGNHLLYCGDTTNQAFKDKLPDASFAFADPPYNSTDEAWDNNFKWNHDYLADVATVVAVTPGIGAIQTFFSKETKMPYKWSMAAWITNGMTRGALGFGNWLYVSLFSKQESIHKNAQDFMRVAIQTSENDKTKHKGRKPSELLEKLFETFTVPGDHVIDPFLGSGTTLLVAEKMGRVCIGGEIEPSFCKEIILRWQEITGQGAYKS